MPFERVSLPSAELGPEWTEALLTPALLVRLPLVRANVARVLALLDGDATRWRPHVKTTKMRPVFAELLRAGLRSFKCATTREAAELAATIAAEGHREADVLVAYPHLGPALARLAEIAGRHPGVRFSVLCEDPAVLARLPDALGVFLDLDPGMNRTGIPLGEGERVLDLARAAGSRLRGLHCYEGHLHQPELAERERAAFAVYERLLQRVAELERAGLPPREIVTSGTPGLLPSLAYEPFRRLASARHSSSAGTVVFHDLRSEEETPSLGLSPAATLLARVVSHPGQGIATCDAGSKSIAAEAGDPVACVLGHPRWRPLAPSEEHLPLAIEHGPLPARGTLLDLVPRHICPTVNLAEQALLLDPPAPPRPTAVSARAHEFHLDARKSFGTEP